MLSCQGTEVSQGENKSLAVCQSVAAIYIYLVAWLKLSQLAWFVVGLFVQALLITDGSLTVSVQTLWTVLDN